MNWYKLSQDNSFLLSKTISQWLVQAYRGPIDTNQLHHDIDSIMPIIDDERVLNSALMSGEAMAKNQLRQVGEMTPIQQEVINAIQSRFTSTIKTEKPQNELMNNVQNEPQTQNVMEFQGENNVENN